MTYVGNPPSTFEQCLRSIKGQTAPPDEIIVVDGNKEGSSESDSMRIGIEKSSGEILFFTNVDCYVPSDWIERHLKWHQRGFDLVSGNRRNINPLSSSWNAFHEGRPQFWQGPGLGWTGSNGSIKRRVVETIGFAPTEPRGWDVWLSIAAVKAGFRMVIDPAIEVLHDHEFPTLAASISRARWSSLQASRIASKVGKDGLDPVLRNTLCELLPVNAVKVWKRYPECKQANSLLRFILNRALFRFGQLTGYLSFPFGFDLWDYAKKQLKFSFGNAFSVPVGIALLFVFTQYFGIWYVESSLLSLIVTTVMNFWIQVAFKVIGLKRK